MAISPYILKVFIYLTTFKYSSEFLPNQKQLQ